MPEDVDVINQAIVRAGEVGFRAIEALKSRMPNPIGKVPEGAQPRLTLSEIQRLLEK